MQGYLGHLDSMHFSIQQLRETMVGRSVKKISKWQLETTCRDAAAHAKCAFSRLPPCILAFAYHSPPQLLLIMKLGGSLLW